ncbi:MAG: hypothetical protein QXT14_06405 [Candidatus Bathyarchaeia archaeon]
MNIYLFRSGTIKYITYAKNIDEAVGKFIKYLVTDNLPNEFMIGLIAEVRRLSRRTRKPIGEPYYCLASPFLVAAGMLPFKDFIKLLEPIGLSVRDALEFVEIAKRQLALMKK